MKNKKEANNDKYFIILGIFLFIIWLIDFIQKLRFYNQYEYLWFCSISVLLLSIGCILRSRTFILSFLPIAFEAQTLWIIDFFLIIFGFHPITNTVAYMFDNGQTLGEFIIGLKHLFVIPIAFLVFMKIKKPIKKYFWIGTVIIGYLILILSPMIPMRNLNCVSDNCFSNSSKMDLIPKLNLNYYIFVVIFSTAFCLFLGYLIYKFIKTSEKNKKTRYIFKLIVIILFLITVGGVLLGFLKYYETPHYYCINEKSNLFCEKAHTQNSTSAYFSYDIYNELGNKCIISAYSNEKVLANREQTIYENPSRGYIFLPLPQKNTNVLIRAVCDNV